MPATIVHRPTRGAGRDDGGYPFSSPDLLSVTQERSDLARLAALYDDFASAQKVAPLYLDLHPKCLLIKRQRPIPGEFEPGQERRRYRDPAAQLPLRRVLRHLRQEGP